MEKEKKKPLNDTIRHSTRSGCKEKKGGIVISIKRIFSLSLFSFLFFQTIGVLLLYPTTTTRYHPPTPVTHTSGKLGNFFFFFFIFFFGRDSGSSQRVVERREKGER
jgi:hypothetical protein